MANNEYGLDTHYFKKSLKLLVRDIDRYTPEEMATALGRLSDTARPLSRSPGCYVADKPQLLKRLDEYIEFAEGCKNYSNVAFYKELKQYVQQI